MKIYVSETTGRDLFHGNEIAFDNVAQRFKTNFFTFHESFKNLPCAEQQKVAVFQN